jgi:tetratricopeptide (TPR) repeat protein
MELEVQETHDSAEPAFDLVDETSAFREKYYRQAHGGNPSARLQYEYAYLLSCSANHDEIRESIDLFRQLYEGGYQRSEVLYQIAQAHFKIGDYKESKRCLAMLLRLEPRNLSAIFLQSLVLDRMAHEGLVMSVVLTVAAGVLLQQVWKAWRR